LKKNRNLLLLAVAVILAAIVYALRDRIHFDWHTFGEQLRLADWRLFVVATSLIWLAYVVRSVRWALFLKPTHRVGPFTLLGTQVIGFTGVALLGRPADLVRPYLVAKRVNATLSSQMAIYVVERMFDAGAMALIFSLALFFAPDRAALPHPELLQRIAKTGLLGTAALATLAISIRLQGERMAQIAKGFLSRFSPSLGHAVSDKINAFREGLATLASFRDVLQALLLSLAMWGMISYAYLETTRAFTSSPQLAGMTLARCMVLMAASMIASTVQLPVIGWFTQIAAVAAAIQQIFGARIEPSLACAAMLLIISFLSIVPVGLLWSRFEHLSLKKLTEESENAGEAAAHQHDEAALVPEV
jgi:hypothetical protein